MSVQQLIYAVRQIRFICDFPTLRKVLQEAQSALDADEKAADRKLKVAYALADKNHKAAEKTPYRKALNRRVKKADRKLKRAIASIVEKGKAERQ